MAYNKFKNKRTEIDGIKFASKAEAKRYQELKILKAAKEIKEFSCQPKFIIWQAEHSKDKIVYIADFQIEDKWGYDWVEDVKGVETKEFKIKQKLFKDKFPFLELRLIRR